MPKIRVNGKGANFFGAAEAWFHGRGRRPQAFQTELWRAMCDGRSGLLTAPTGSGKTLAVGVGALLDGLARGATGPVGLQVLWITPVRALAHEIALSLDEAATGLGLGWRVGVRTGDTSSADRRSQRAALPEILVTTPESLHHLLATPGCSRTLGGVRWLVVDEWHELIGSKRGVALELAREHLFCIQPNLGVWGLSATLGNPTEARAVLVGPERAEHALHVHPDLRKSTEVIPVMPDAVEPLPWAGHLGLGLAPHVVDIVRAHRSTLVFTNTRAQAERWYRRLLEEDPELAGVLAVHHGSLDGTLRRWVEDGLRDGALRAVVCTSSLDLGVDFGPVEAVVQIGGPKGVARFAQRAGRSGHRPGAVSRIHFVPTHGLELLECVALREALAAGTTEPRTPLEGCWDVLVQFLCTLALGEGWQPEKVRNAVLRTWAFRTMDEAAWAWCLAFITTGGPALAAYDDFRRVVPGEVWRMPAGRLARRARMSIGTIVSDPLYRVRKQRGGLLGHVEASFATSLEVGQSFWFAGECLELLRAHDSTLFVKTSTATTHRVPSYQGGRLPLSSELASGLRKALEQAAEALATGSSESAEIQRIRPLLEVQADRSHLPERTHLLVEWYADEDGFHTVIFPFCGRLVHEAMAMVCAQRLSRRMPKTFTWACNDYGFELLTDASWDVPALLVPELFRTEGLSGDILTGVNAAELARRRFRDISVIAGLTFTGFPGAPVKDRHILTHAGLLFEVLQDHDPGNLLVQQAFDELLAERFEWTRLVAALDALRRAEWKYVPVSGPTPLAFPLAVDRLRERLSSERLEDRIRRMVAG